MARYALHNRAAGTQQAVSTAYKTLVNIIGATTRRARMWQVAFGADGAPNATDCQMVWDLCTKDATTAGTGTSATSNIIKLNSADGAPQLTAAVNYTAEPTVFTSVFNFAINQRASQLWTAFDQDQCVVMPATANFGLAVRVLSPTYTNNALATMVFEET